MITIGKYELHESLGRGGFGTVYRGRDTLLNVPRAVKVLHPALVADPEFIARFRLEAQIAARLEHPHIVPVYDLGEQDGRFFLAMRLMPGGSLKDRLSKGGRLPFAEAVRVITQVAAALDFAYQSPEKLIHRDVKPGNILLEADGTARLADFGFAKALEGEGSASLSASGGLVGTLAYLAPEIWNSQPASPLSDQYSLACVFYELITGQSLFGGGDSPLPVVMKRHLDPLSLPAQWPAGVPDGVSAVLRKALAKTPQERYPSAGAFARALESCSQLSVGGSRLPVGSSPLPAGGNQVPVEGRTPASRPVAARSAGPLFPVHSPLPPAPSPTRQRKWLGLGAAVVFLLCLVIAIPVAFLGKRYIPDLVGFRSATSTLTERPTSTRVPTKTLTPTVTKTFSPTITSTPSVDTETPTVTNTFTPIPTVTNTPTPATPLLRDDFSDQNAQNWQEWGENWLITIIPGEDPAMQLNTTSLISGGASSIVDTISLVPGLEISFTALVNYPASTSSSTATAPQLRFAWSPGIQAPYQTSEDLGVEIIISPLEVRITIYKADGTSISETHILTATENTYRVEVKDDGSLEFYLNDEEICETLSVPIPPYTLSGGRIHFSGQGLVDDILVIVEP